MKTKKILSIIVLFALLINTNSLSFASSNNSKTANNINNISIPSFPEDTRQNQTDWSMVDWDRAVVLPEDKEEYNKKLEELLEKGNMDEINNLGIKKTNMYDDKALNTYKVPKEVKKIVKKYYEDNNGISIQDAGKKLSLKQKLREIQNGVNNIGNNKNNISNEETSTQEELPEIELNKFKKINNYNIDSIDVDTKTPSDLKIKEIIK